MSDAHSRHVYLPIIYICHLVSVIGLYSDNKFDWNHVIVKQYKCVLFNFCMAYADSNMLVTFQKTQFHTYVEHQMEEILFILLTFELSNHIFCSSYFLPTFVLSIFLQAKYKVVYFYSITNTNFMAITMTCIQADVWT